MHMDSKWEFPRDAHLLEINYFYWDILLFCTTFHSSLSLWLISEWKALEHRIAAARFVIVRAVNKSGTVRWARWRGDKGLGGLRQILLLPANLLNSFFFFNKYFWGLTLLTNSRSILFRLHYSNSVHTLTIFYGKYRNYLYRQVAERPKYHQAFLWGDLSYFVYCMSDVRY